MKIITIFATVLLSTSSYAGGLGEWNGTAYDGANFTVPSRPNLPSVVLSNIVASNKLALGSNFQTSNWGTGTTVDLTRYFEFSISVTDPSKLVSPIGFDASLRYDYAEDLNFHWQIRSSLDNFGTTITEVTQNYSDYHLFLDLSSLEPFYANSSVTFRVYGYSTQSSNYNVDFGFSYLPGQLTAIPEPSVSMLLISFALTWIIHKGRTRRCS